MWELYSRVRSEYLRAVRGGNPDKVRRVLRKNRSLLEEEETLLAPIYFLKPDVVRVVVEEVSRLFGRDRFYHRGLYGLLHWFGEAQTKELERDVLRFLRHRRSDMRYIALNVLTLHWNMRKHRWKYVKLMNTDPDVSVRSLAATGLGHVLAVSRDRKASHLMVRTMKDNSEDFSVRRAAYRALRAIWIPWRRLRVESAGYFRDKLDETVENDLAAWKQWVDWDFVARAERGSLRRRPTGMARSKGVRGPRRATLKTSR